MMMISLHSMTCAKCNHGFCWRCLKPWKPTHKDYYNCSAMVCSQAPSSHSAQHCPGVSTPAAVYLVKMKMISYQSILRIYRWADCVNLLLFQVSKAARQEKKFQDYNSRCTFHHQAKVHLGLSLGFLSFVACPAADVAFRDSWSFLFSPSGFCKQPGK